MSRARLVLAAPAPADALADAFARLPGLLTDADGPVSARAAGATSTWRLNARGGSGGWTQHDHRDVDGTSGRSTLVDGDLTGLDLTWRVRPTSPGASDSTVEIDADLQTGMAHLAGALDPVLLRVLLRAVRDGLDGVVGPVEVTEGLEHLDDLPHLRVGAGP